MSPVPIDPAQATVVVTGAAGDVGMAIRPLLRATVGAVHLIDQRPIRDAQPGERVFVGDVRHGAALAPALRGATALIHLAGLRSDAPWDVLQRDSIDVAAAVLASASASGIHRIALASSMHVLGGYRRRERISPASAPRPDSSYAESKRRIELLGHRHAAVTGARVTAVRIGCLKADRADSEPVGWIGPTDLARLLLHVLFHRRGNVPVAHAVAPHRGDDCGQRRLWWRHGFRFHERAESRAAGLRRTVLWYPNDPVARAYRGGSFASQGGWVGRSAPDSRLAVERFTTVEPPIG